MRNRMPFVLSLLVVANLVLSQSVLAQNPPAARGTADRAAPVTPAAGTPAKLDTAPPVVDPKTYSIGTGDILFVRVWREQDFTGPYPVRPDGRITVPLVGDMQAAGLTPERLGEQLKQALSEFINSPDVTVSLQQINSKKFFISGEVNRPGEYILLQPTRVFDALSNASGFREFANKKKIVIVRGAERIRFNYLDVLKGKNLEQNIFLENGDTVIVP